MGGRTGRALARRGGAVVERQAPERLRRPDRSRGVARRRTARCSTAKSRHLERVLLEIRLRDGLPLELVDSARVEDVVRRELGVLEQDHLVLTRKGRLLADAVVRDLVD